MEKKSVSLNVEQRLYVIPCGDGYTCYGWGVLHAKHGRLAEEMQKRGLPFVGPGNAGTLEAYAAWETDCATAQATGCRFTCELSPQLVGLEGKRVEVVEEIGHPPRCFTVGKSTGWMPCHLEIVKRGDHGGLPASLKYHSVRSV